MNEDETFRKLRRVTFEQLESIRRKILTYRLRLGSLCKDMDNSINYEKYGWSRQEYINEWKKKYSMKL